MNIKHIELKICWIIIAVVLASFPAYGVILHPAQDIQAGTFTGDRNYIFDDCNCGISVYFNGKIFVQNGIHTDQNVIAFGSPVIVNYTNLTAPSWVQLSDGSWTTPGFGGYITTANGSYTTTGPGASNANISYPGIYNLVPNGNLTFISDLTRIFMQGADDFGPTGMFAATVYRNAHWEYLQNVFIKDTLYTSYLWISNNETKFILNTTTIPKLSIICKRANDSQLGYCGNDLNMTTGVCTCI
jgi:hypothetical protein